MIGQFVSGTFNFQVLSHIHSPRYIGVGLARTKCNDIVFSMLHRMTIVVVVVVARRCTGVVQGCEVSVVSALWSEARVN